MKDKNKKNFELIARKNLLRKADETSGVKIKGYDFDKGVNYRELMKCFSSTGFQATNFAKAIDILRDAIQDKAFVYLGYTSNMVSSGLRDVFKWLIKNKKVNVIVTTAGGIEEDIIKCFGDFHLGDFRTSGEHLRKKGINRIGNIFVSNNRYVEFEKFFQEILEEFYARQKSSGKLTTTSEIIWKLGEEVGKKEKGEESICYWAWKNKIKIYCPAILDGAIGDNVYFFKFKNPDFVLDISEDIKQFNDTTLGLKKSAALILGSGIVKHCILNANMLRNGADYAVYINNAQEFDGSDADVLPEEAVSWGKILPKAKSIKVFGDATILVPLLVSETFAKNI